MLCLVGISIAGVSVLAPFIPTVLATVRSRSRTLYRTAGASDGVGFQITTAAVQRRIEAPSKAAVDIAWCTAGGILAAARTTGPVIGTLVAIIGDTAGAVVADLVARKCSRTGIPARSTVVGVVAQVDTGAATAGARTTVAIP